MEAYVRRLGSESIVLVLSTVEVFNPRTIIVKSLADPGKPPHLNSSPAPVTKYSIAIKARLLEPQISMQLMPSAVASLS